MALALNYTNGVGFYPIELKGAPIGAPILVFAVVCRSADQLRDLSTILPLEIQGIIARSFSPTCSIWCSSLRRRVALK